MKKNELATKQPSQLALAKTKNLMSITSKILARKNNAAVVDKSDIAEDSIPRDINLLSQLTGLSLESPSLKDLIASDGIDHASTRLAEITNQKIPSLEIASQFILEELEAASQGNQVAIDFACNSGIPPQIYQNSMNNSFESINGANGPQQFLLALTMSLQPDMDMVAEFRVNVVDKIMRHWRIGKYENIGYWILPSSGLMWEIKNGSNIDSRYSWLKANEYSTEMNMSTYLGFNDWRLPTLEEMRQLSTPHKNNNYLIQAALSTNVNYSGYGCYWTSSNAPNFQDRALAVSFDHGAITANLLHEFFRVRLVRNTDATF